MRASWVLALSVPVALLLSGCHGPDELGLTSDQGESVRSPADSPRFPVPETGAAGPRITFWYGSEVMQVICIEESAECRPAPPPSEVERFDVPHTGTLVIRAKFANTSDRVLDLEDTRDCRRIRAWLDVWGQAVELQGDDRGGCNGGSVLPYEEEQHILEHRFLIDPAELFAREGAQATIGGTYRLYGAFDSPTSTWNATGSAWVHLRDARDLPRVAIERGGNAPDYRFNVTFHNTSNLTFLYTTPTSCGGVQAIIEGAGQHVNVPDSTQGTHVCLQAFTRQAIPPGEVRTDSFEWDGRFDGRAAEPGTYTFNARFGGEPLWDTTGALDFVVP